MKHVNWDSANTGSMPEMKRLIEQHLAASLTSEQEVVYELRRTGGVEWLAAHTVQVKVTLKRNKRLDP